ncbi:MAG: dipeptide/oligopeptide/nickel ABC transporter ATP-binding protein [Corynebacterium sp.]|nr:dipeptide/oligopeptide/nickel ABC transporter ATP-binding protein [Corynebacterium sp.]
MSFLEVRSVSQTYPDSTRGLENVSLHAQRGRTLGIVGESGSGKSTLARCILGLVAVDAGYITIDGADISALHGAELRRAQQHTQLVFQNPRTALNDRITICTSFLEPLLALESARRKELLAGLTVEEFATQWMRRVHLDPQVLDQYPGQLSGGQLQRIAIARALSTQAELVILDEPTASLDVSVQASVLNLLKDLQAELGTTFVFISHDLAAVRFIADDIVVMKAGEIVDCCPAAEVTSPARSAYTQELVALFRGQQGEKCSRKVRK